MLGTLSSFLSGHVPHCLCVCACVFVYVLMTVCLLCLSLIEIQSCHKMIVNGCSPEGLICITVYVNLA